MTLKISPKKKVEHFKFVWKEQHAPDNYLFSEESKGKFKKKTEENDTEDRTFQNPLIAAKFEPISKDKKNDQIS